MVISPFFENTGSAPVCISRKQPVPYVFFTSPASKQHCPNSALCWSPAAPATGIFPPNSSTSDSPYMQLEGCTFGSICSGIPKSSNSSASQRRRRMSNSIVREAFVTSVTCALPPVSFQISQVSIVPKSSSPASALCRAPGTLSRIQRSFVPEKYASGTRPVFSRIRSDQPAATSASAMGAVRLHCHTIAGQTGSPVALSQTTVVSRWFVMPMAAMSAADRPSCCMALLATSRVVSQISAASCSTQPGFG